MSNENEFEYRGHLVFNGLYETRINPHGGNSTSTSESLREKLTSRLKPFSRTEAQRGSGYEDIELTEAVENASRIDDDLKGITNNLIDKKYKYEDFGSEEEIVDDKGEIHSGPVRNIKETYVYWRFPNLMFIQGAEKRVEKTIGDLREALGATEADEEDNVLIYSLDFPRHFLLWLIYQVWNNERIGSGVDIHRISGVRTEGSNDGQSHFGNTNEVGDSTSIVRSTPFIEAISHNKLPTRLEGTFRVFGRDVIAQIYEEGRVRVKAQEDLKPAEDHERVLISLQFLSQLVSLRNNWGDKDPQDQYVPPSFIEELDNIAEQEGIDITFSRANLIEDLIDNRNESPSDWTHLRFS